MRDPKTGTLDRIMSIHSLHPDGLETHYQLYRTVMTGSESLPKVDREMRLPGMMRIALKHEAGYP